MKKKLNHTPKTIVLQAIDALRDMSITLKLIHIFWLCGPFFLLIERSPADFWLTICGLAFFINVTRSKNFSFLGHFWIKATLLFWFISILSAIFSELPMHSFGEAFVWIRFPLFAASCVYFFGTDQRLINAMLLSSGIGMVLMTFILLVELTFVGQTNGRLTWPYGDMVPGGYLAKATLPIVVLLAAFVTSSSSRLGIFIGIFGILSLVMSLMTGERVNLILRGFAAALGILFWRPKLRVAIFWLLASLSSIGAIVLIVPQVFNRLIRDFWSFIPTSLDGPYGRVWKGALNFTYENMIIGIGPDNYRMLCSSLNEGQADVDCHTHPHNFYIQLLAETGIIGLTVGSVMLLAIVGRCFRFRKNNPSNIFVGTAFISPLGFFFPFQTTSDFFGQWNNIFIWTAVGLCLAAANLVSRNQAYKNSDD